MILQVLTQFFVAVQMKIIVGISDFILGSKVAHIRSKMVIFTVRVKNQNRAISWPVPAVEWVENIQNHNFY